MISAGAGCPVGPGLPKSSAPSRRGRRSFSTVAACRTAPCCPISASSRSPSPSMHAPKGACEDCCCGRRATEAGAVVRLDRLPAGVALSASSTPFCLSWPMIAALSCLGVAHAPGQSGRRVQTRAKDVRCVAIAPASATSCSVQTRSPPHRRQCNSGTARRLATDAPRRRSNFSRSSKAWIWPAAARR